MKIIKVNLKERTYNIIVGSHIIGLLGKQISALNLGMDAYVITNVLVKRKYGSLLAKTLAKAGLSARFRIIPDSESSKSIACLTALLADLAKYDLKRKIFIIAFGGGVVGDLAGFAASIYKRGIPYIQVPTTLLAQVDSSIGGKTGLDLAEGKNLAGAFYQPRLVLTDTAFLKSLSLRQLRSGLAEVIKYGLISDRKMFRFLEYNYRQVFRYDTRTLEYLVSRSSAIKSRIVSLDERESKGLRTVLNLGHTIGHAIEAAGGYTKYNHGEAVALGMVFASDLSRRLGFIGTSHWARVRALIRNVGLPVEIKGIFGKDIIKAHYHDKKFSGAKNRFVLLKGIGSTKIIEDIPLDLVSETLKKQFSNRI